MALFIGLMSGTSMDGIDAALVDLSTNTLIAGITRAYSDDARQRLAAVLGGEQTTMAAFSQLNTVLGREFALAVHQLLNQANIHPQQVTAIGSHGQTICHDATANIPYTVQLGCAHTIAEATGITVIADFRARDLVVGGQGAPFAPIYHQVLFADSSPLAVVNIGGIANVTFLAPDKNTCGYDTGPGNCLLDAWAQKHLGVSYDAGGAWGASGQVIGPLLTTLLADPYFALAVPKSIDKGYFSENWLAQYVHPSFAAHDIQATLVALTALSIGQAIKAHEVPMMRLAVCGGGVHNDALMHALQQQLPSIQVMSSAHLGVDPDFLEAMMFAWLAEQTLNNCSIDLTHITGAKHPTILGAVYWARS